LLKTDIKWFRLYIFISYKILGVEKNNWNIFSYLLLTFQIAILISQGSVLEFYEIRRFYFLFHWKLDKCVSYQQLEKETCFGNDRHKNTLPLETIENSNFSFYIPTKMAEFGLSSSILHIRKLFFSVQNVGWRPHLSYWWHSSLYNSFKLRVKFQAPVGAAFYCYSGNNSFMLLRMKMINHMPHRADAPFKLVTRLTSTHASKAQGPNYLSLSVPQLIDIMKTTQSLE
jgi:hypothetical protein